MAHGFKMLCSPDATVKKVAESTLEQVVSKRLNRVASRREQADYLSGEMAIRQSTAQTTSWAKVTSVTARIKTKLGSRWRWDEDRQSF